MKKKTVLALAALLCVSVQSGSVFATNEYNIEYSGGAPLSSKNVKVETSLATMTPLYKFKDKENKAEIKFSNSNKWKSGYLKGVEGSCTEYHYLSFSSNQQFTADDDVSYTISTSKYDAKIQIEKLVIDGESALSEVGVSEYGGIGAGHILYKDDKCQTKVDDDLRGLKTSDNRKLFVQTNIKLYKHGTEDVFTSDELYFGIIDIDAAQSYKILNSGSLLTKDSMYAMSESAFKTPDDLENRFVATGNYIYSQYSSETGDHFDNEETNNIFAKIDTATQRNGLEMVFGFATGAGSGVEYYAQQYTVKYRSDEGGKIDGITNEDVISGQNASGSSIAINDGYTFKYWIADEDVILEDGTKIKAGSKITSEQVKQVVVKQNITFTAINAKDESPANAPDTGIFTEDSGGLIYTVGIAVPVGIVVIALISYIAKRNVRKVSFKK